MKKSVLVFIVMFIAISCAENEEESIETWSMSFSNGVSTSNYKFEVPKGFRETNTSSCLICCGGTIVSWDEVNNQITASTTCMGGNIADTDFSGLITGDSIQGGWMTIWTNGNSDAGTFKGAR